MKIGGGRQATAMKAVELSLVMLDEAMAGLWVAGATLLAELDVALAVADAVLVVEEQPG
jgi:hypothetical protein